MTDQNQKHYGRLDGKPVGPDVSLLQKTYTSLKPGDRILYMQVETLLGVPYGSTRFKTITDSWRTRELNRGVVIRCERGIAFYVATPDQTLSGTYGTLEHARRAFRKQRKRLLTIRTEDEQTRVEAQNHVRIMVGNEQLMKRQKPLALPGCASDYVGAPPPKLEDYDLDATQSQA